MGITCNYRLCHQLVILVLGLLGVCAVGRLRGPLLAKERGMKKFVVEDSFWELFPEVEIGIVCLDGILPSDQISDENIARAEELLNKANGLAGRWLDNPTVSKNEVVAVWRKAYQQFKTKKGARCSVENLMKRVLKDNPVGHIVPSVDITNAVSLKYALPIGIENIDAIEGTFCLRKTEGGDYFLPIGEEESDPTLPGEVAYIDDAGAVCRCWNWRDGQRTEASDETPHCTVIMENVDPARSADLHAAIDEVAQLAEEILGARVTNKDFLTREHAQTELA